MSDSDKPEIPRTPRPADSGRVPSLEETQRYSKRRGQLDDEIERELQEAMGDASFDQLIAEQPKKPAGGTPGKLKGRIISIHGQDVFVEVPGGRSQGILPLLQFTEGPPKIGDEVEVTIEGSTEGSLILSRKGAATVVADWSSVTVGMIVEARVTETNKNKTGLMVDVNGIRGFMPVSQIDLYRVENVDQYVGQRLRCVVAEADPEERNLVVSRKALLQEERAEAQAKVWAELAEGQVRDGVVRSIREFGAFVDIGGVDGLLPISQLSWSRVDKVEDVVKLGQAVRVQVLKVDREHKKVSLGLKQLSASPWDTVAERYIPGSIVKGKVSRLAEFGAFVELEPAVEGLIHISELAPQRVFRVKDIVQVDQEVTVKVVSVDVGSRRIGLSLKQAAAEKAPPPEEVEEEDEYTPPPPRPRNPNLRGGISS